ncbi:ParB/RepB/Spo0J family partition protein [bacterium]|nr:ParB/RepB/Spo0J family partition protein [bacterium]
MTNQTPRLGKGLEALIPRSIFAAGKSLMSLPISSIKANPFQPRKAFEPTAMASLVDSIRQHGLNQPVLVRRVGNHYELIAGERRFRACSQAGLEQIPAIIKNVSDEESLQLALIENIERQDLNPLEVARGYQRLVDEFGYTHQLISEAFGRSRSAVSNTIRLLNLPNSIQRALEDGDISEGHARTLLSLGSESAMLDYVSKIKAGEMNVRQIEGEAASKRAKENLDNGIQMPLFSELEARLKERFSTKVVISGRPQKGKITLYYSNEGEFRRLMASLDR